MYEKLRELHPVYARALRGPGLLGLFWTLAAGIALWGALSLFNGTDNFVNHRNHMFFFSLFDNPYIMSTGKKDVHD